MTHDLKALRDKWNQSVGRASGISFDVAMMLSENPNDLEKILSASDSGMAILDRIKKQHDKAERLIKFAGKFRKPIPGSGAVSGDWADRLRSGRPANMGGITEHFERARHNPFNYGTKPVATTRFPLITSSTAAEFRLKDEKQRIAAMASMKNATAAFYGTRNNQNWDDYLTGRTGDWSGYDPSNGPLGDLFRKQERDERRRSVIFGASDAISRYEREDIEEQRQMRVDRVRERRQQDSRNSIAVRNRQLDSYRKFPWVKSLVDSGFIQKRELPKIAKILNRMSKVPIAGGFIRHPIALGATSIAAFIASFVNRQNRANVDTTLWENAEMFFGKPSKKFTEAANSALITDPKAVANLWGKFSKMGFDPETALRIVGQATKNRPAVVKNAIAGMFGGLSPDEVVAAEFFVGAHKESQSRNQAKKLKQLEIEETKGFKSGAGILDRIRSYLLWIPLEKSLESRGMSWLTFGGTADTGGTKILDRIHIEKKPVFDIFGNWEREQKAADAAAESAREYDAGKIGNKQSSTGMNVSKNIAFNIGTLQVDAENAEQLMQSLMKEGAERDHLGIIEATDTRIRV